MIIVVTGASGFVGSAVCRAARAAGHQVLALGRRRTVPADLIAGAPYLSWDLADPEARPALPAPFTHPDAVIHCAGLATDWARPEAFHRGNVLATRGALAAFPETARFVHLSTASVYDPRRPTVMAREDEADAVRHTDAYGRSKALAEASVRQARPDAVILRPHAVYGPGDTTLLPRVLQAVRRTPCGPRLFAIGDGRQRLSLTSVANLVDACLLAAGGRACGTFNITDREPVVLDDVLRQVMAAHGLPPTPVYLPLAVALPAARTAELLARTTLPPPPAGGTSITRRPRLTVYAVRHLAHERTLDLTAARTHLAYQPQPTDLEPALRRN
ncbi:NAD(P)-dependent oxidoreductase [Streptomyces sp. SP17BM10]|uniref:NAD-dependent epimerase/dehydratase family protein n=1 Tax=Streptomyces sp. SP17BM10 TaxID=3002530 RepID=UPI002E783EEB|nr:NAD(P)-dependent oxidoreductase [Streptomyces sp. SP17BM10]MEE1788237.1 NAD(P)-dependent oxidoreductase [Streptomyces sp. SP17BM10]